MTAKPHAAKARRIPPPAPPCVMVIFGAGGDLAKRLLAPALCNLAQAGRLDDGFKVLGVDHNANDDAAFAVELGAFLRGLAAQGDGAVLYHCTAGKDRTGMVTAILLELAGVDRDAIIHNYAISASYLH